jgi:hypothetical protein
VAVEASKEITILAITVTGGVQRSTPRIPIGTGVFTTLSAISIGITTTRNMVIQFVA